MAKNSFPCGSDRDMSINSGNSDSKCHRLLYSYAKKLVIDSDFEVCENCVYKEIAEQALKEDK